MLTRFAPTPSGYLHRGNLVNLAVVAAVAREIDGRLMLRIDDADTDRRRPKYTADVFRALDWLEVRPDVGPQGVLDVPRWSQSARVERYQAALVDIERDGGDVFGCACSRTTLVDGRCVAGCRVPVAARVDGVHAVRLHGEHADITLWGKHHPAYHLVSCVDDIDYGVTHVVRGDDLAPSTQVHRVINALLGSAGPRYAHHALVTAADGAKLSKSQGTARLELTDSLRRDVRTEAERLLPEVLRQFEVAHDGR